MDDTDTEKDHHHHHHHNYQSTTTTATPVLKPPLPDDTDDTGSSHSKSKIPAETDDVVDGVLFNNGPVHNGVPATPEPGVDTLPHHHHTRTPSVTAPIRVYLTRFWILATFSFMAMFQCLMWNTWGPISASMNAAYPGWGSETVAMMSNWGTITFVTFVVPMCWVMNTKGLRAGVVLCGALVASGTVVRALPLLVSSNTTFFTVMCHACAILNGIAGTLVMAAPPLIAAVWFPPKERTTATAFGQMMNMLGNGGSYLEPLMVREPSSNPDAEEVEAIQSDIKRLMYIWAGVGVAMIVVLVAYFPAKPPTPPSLTSHVERLDFMGSIKMMFRNKDLLLLMVPYGISVGLPAAWISVLNFSLSDLGMSQNDAMWVGVTVVLASCVLTLLAGRFTDLIYGHIKLSLIITSAITIFSFYWFFVLSWQGPPVATWEIYVSVACGNAFSAAMCPLFFELAVESVYPCSEVMVGGLLTAFNNLVGLCFLFLFLVDFPSYQWVTYVLLCGTSASLIPLSFAREDYSRSNIDRHQPHSPYQYI